MNICPYCEHNNRAGIIICAHCGRSFTLLGAGMATLMKHDSSLFVETAEATAVAEDDEYFAKDACAVIYVAGASEPHMLRIDALAVLGRASSDRAIKPHLDLSAYEAYNRGVSARHAALQRTETHLFLRDLGSTNGTYLNGERLAPYQPQIIHDGDEVYLGQLMLRISFEPQTKPAREG
jgi:FHA domain